MGGTPEPGSRAGVGERPPGVCHVLAMLKSGRRPVLSGGAGRRGFAHCWAGVGAGYLWHGVPGEPRQRPWPFGLGESTCVMGGRPRLTFFTKSWPKLTKSVFFAEIWPYKAKEEENRVGEVGWARGPRGSSSLLENAIWRMHGWAK